MKRKRPKRTPPTQVSPSKNSSQRSESTIEVIDLDADISNFTGDDTSTTATASQSSLKRSWVWNHFQDSANGNYAVCQVMMKNLKCGTSLKKDWSGSTKNFHEHLLKRHKLVDPKLNKKIDETQADIAKYLMNGKITPKVFFFVILFC